MNRRSIGPGVSVRVPVSIISPPPSSCSGPNYPAMETEAQRAARYAAKDVVDKLGVKPGDALLFEGPKKDADLVKRMRMKAGRPPARAGEQADVIVFWPARAQDVTVE